ncbi:heat shock protein 70, partial [Striga asiatica]
PPPPTEACIFIALLLNFLVLLLQWPPKHLTKNCCLLTTAEGNPTIKSSRSSTFYREAQRSVDQGSLDTGEIQVETKPSTSSLYRVRVYRWTRISLPEPVTRQVLEKKSKSGGDVKSKKINSTRGRQRRGAVDPAVNFYRVGAHFILLFTVAGRAFESPRQDTNEDIL